MPSLPHLSVCVCTYQRPVWLARLLGDLGRQDTNREFTFEIVVADNDAPQSAKPVVAESQPKSPVRVIYCAEPRRSISYVRNHALAHATGNVIVFIDDDEFPTECWLLNLFRTWQKAQVAGVLGPVRPYFDEEAPAWIRCSGLYDRPEHPTGFQMPWQECRTGNVLFGRRVIAGIEPVFRPEFGASGGDVDFFRRMTQSGHRFIWCNEAVVYEHVPPSRWDRRVLVSRALLRGRNSFRHPVCRPQKVLKAMVAVPAYALALPLLQLRGHHLFIRYLVKLCHHVGLLFGAIGLDPVKQRKM